MSCSLEAVKEVLILCVTSAALWAGVRKPSRFVARRFLIYLIPAPSWRLAGRYSDLHSFNEGIALSILQANRIFCAFSRISQAWCPGLKFPCSYIRLTASISILILIPSGHSLGNSCCLSTRLRAGIFLVSRKSWKR